MARTDPSQSSVTIREAATLLGVHPNTVRNRIKAGIYIAEKVITSSGPTYLIQRSSLSNSPTTNSSPKDLRRLPNNLLEASPQDLQALLSSVVEEAIVNTQAEAAEREELARAREGAIEILKLEHNSVQHMGTLSLAAIAAFGAILGVFSDPKVWDGSFHAIPISRPVLVFSTFGAFLLSAITARAVEVRIRDELRRAATANAVTEIATMQEGLKSLRNREVWDRVLLALAFGLGALGFLVFIAQSTPV